MWGYDSERQGKAGSSNDNYRIAGDELRPQSAALLDALSPVTPVPPVYDLSGQLAVCVCAVTVLVEAHNLPAHANVYPVRATKAVTAAENTVYLGNALRTLTGYCVRTVRA